MSIALSGQPKRPVDARVWTAADLVARFGPISLGRIRSLPAPGTATEDDLLAIHNSESRLFELVDGVLVEKTMGVYESYLAGVVITYLNIYLHHQQPKRGFVLGPDGMVRLFPRQVRIPDVSYVAWARFPDRRIPRSGIGDFAPDLAVEVISLGNTREEMDSKLQDYFRAGVRLVWYVFPREREVHVFTAVDQRTILSADKVLDGGDVLPGFTLPLAELFAEPIEPAEQ
jgi:Uma2 family endonuclease